MPQENAASSKSMTYQDHVVVNDLNAAHIIVSPLLGLWATKQHSKADDTPQYIRFLSLYILLQLVL